MKTYHFSSRKSHGSVLMATLFITGVVTLVLISYLSLISTQHRSVARSQRWNASLPVVEAGIEESMGHLNRNCLSNGINPVNYTADGWQTITGGYSKTNSLPDGSYYSVQIYLTNISEPNIIVQGFVPIGYSSAGSPIFATVGANTTPSYISRKVHVIANNEYLFSKGMVAKGDVGWNGNIWSDSFDSQDPAHSNALGQYELTKRKDNGSIASVNGVITMGGGVIFGSAATGPGGTASGGTVGDLAWVTGGNSGIQPGHYTDDMNVSFPNVQAPFTNGYATPGAGTASVTNYTYGTTQVTSDVYPSPVPAGGIVTNRLTTVTSLICPDPIPFGGVITNNNVLITLTNLPGIIPAGLTTNTILITQTNIPSVTPYTTNTTAAHTTNYPAAGTYMGTITNTSITTGPKSGRGTWYDYLRITGYSYSVISYQYTTQSYTYTAPGNYNYTYASITTNSIVTTSSYSYVLGNGNYQLSSLSLSGQSAMLVNGNATLYVTGSMAMAGQSQIIIAPGATLRLYCGGDVDLKGNGIMNNSSSALNFQLFGLPTCTDIDLGGNAAFTGVMYAPQATFSAGGGGNNQYDCVGAIIVKDAHMNGHFTFHYDEAIGRIGPARGFVIFSWKEI